MKNKILNILKESDDFISGQKISDKLNITRAAVWKYINAFKEEGYEIESISRRGYKLISSPDILPYEEIEKYLNTDFIGRDTRYFDSIDSTNKKAKELALDAKEGTVVISEEQIGGKGRLGRTWISPKNKGIWMSIVLKPSIEPSKVSKVTQIGAIAVVKALENMGIKSQIKWPNDILVNGKKICGILTEMSGELNMIDYIIMGIGINVNLDEKDIPNDLKHKATSIKIEEGKYIDRKKLTANILNTFEKYYIDFKKDGELGEIIDILRESSILIGKTVRIITRGETRFGKVIDINKDGELQVEFETGIENIYSGEVSVRGIDGYI